MPDSIAGLSESGVNAKHTGKSCSHLELVVRECWLMLQGMVSVFLIDCEAFLRICRIRSVFPGPREIGERNQEPVYRDSWLSYLPKLHSGRNIRDIHGRWEKNPSMEFPDFLLHTFILHKPLIFTTSLEIFIKKWPMHSSSTISTMAKWKNLHAPYRTEKLQMWCSLPADRHLTASVTLSACTEILRCAQDDGGGGKENRVTQGSYS